MEHYALRFGETVDSKLKSRLLCADLQHRFGLVGMEFMRPRQTDYLLVERNMAPKEFDDQELRDYLDSAVGRNNYRLINIKKALDALVS